MLRFPLLTLTALLLVQPALAEDEKEPRGPAWDSPEARQEADRVLGEVQRLIGVTERGDGRPAVKSLRDPSWILRRLAIVRLEALGMKGKAVQLLKARAQPHEDPPPEGWKYLLAAKKFADRRQGEVLQTDGIDRSEAIRIVGSIVIEQFRATRQKPPARVELVSNLLSYRACLAKRKDRSWLAESILGLTDRDRALADLGMDLKRALSRGGRRVYAWYAKNVTYLYYHPRQVRLLVDVKARTARVPTREYRKLHPWRRGEGPKSLGRPRVQ